MLMTHFSLHYTALYLSVSFVILILNIKLLFSPIMMSFCRKSVHSLLSGLTTTTAATGTTHPDHHHHHALPNPNPIWSKGLIGLVTPSSTADDDGSPPNVVESSAKPRKDPGGIGLLDAAVDGLASCTESLGSESSDERRADGGCESQAASPAASGNAGERRKGRAAAASEAPRRTFPPPLPSLDRNGKPSFFLRPVRKDGRLELTEVRINRPEILRAYRGNGRLRLHLVRDDMDCIEEEDEEEEQEKEEDDDDQDRFVRSNSSGSSSSEGLRRCHDQVNQHNHHHHRIHLWRQQHCVTTT